MADYDWLKFMSINYIYEWHIQIFLINVTSEVTFRWENHTFQLESAAANLGSLERNFIGRTVVEDLVINICFVVFSLFLWVLLYLPRHLTQAWVSKACSKNSFFTCIYQNKTNKNKYIGPSDSFSLLLWLKVFISSSQVVFIIPQWALEPWNYLTL